MLRLLHLSDLHLGWQPRFLGRLCADRALERNDVLRKAVDIALDDRHAIDVVVIAGDLFDSHHPDAGVVEGALRQLYRIDKAGKLIIVVPGNHDEITYHDSVYRQHQDRFPGLLVREPNPSHIATVSVNDDDVHIYSVAYTAGLTWCDRPLNELPRLQESGVHIGVFHGSLDWNGGERSLPLSSSELARADYTYTALGHFHRSSEHRLGNGVAAYCGAPEARGFDDTGMASVKCVQIDSHGVKIQAIPLALRPQYVIDIQLDDLDSEAALYNHVMSLANPAAIVRLQLVGTAAFAIDEAALLARCEGLFYYLDVRDLSDGVSAGQIATLSHEPSIRGTFVKRLLKRMENAQSEDEKANCLRAVRLCLRAYRVV